MVLLQRELYFPKDREGGQDFPVGSNFFQGGRGRGGGPNANFYINPYNLWFSRGGGPDPLYPTLDPHMGDTPEIMNL